jgi:hypothetical protein
MLSDLLSCFPEAHREDLPIIRMALLARAADSKFYKRQQARQLKDALHTELDQYIAAGNAPRNRKHTEEILHHRERIDEMALLVILPSDAESRSTLSRAIREERQALGDSCKWFED